MDVSGHVGFIKDYVIPIEGMGLGIYIINWRGLGADGHALNGKFSFMVE
jgi:methionine-rich copper-binding protein CopC